MNTSTPQHLNIPALLLIAAVLCIAAPVQAQQVRVHLSADTVQIGGRFTLSLVAEHNFSEEVVFPAADAPVFGDLEVIARTDTSNRYRGSARPGTRVDSVSYEVTTFALDSARVPPIPVSFVEGADTARARTLERLVRVRSVLSAAARAGRDTSGLKPLAPPATFPMPLWPVLLAVLVLAAAYLAAGYWIWRRLRKLRREHAALRDQTAAAPTPAPPATPHEAARRRLRRLEADTDLGDQAAIKPFYTTLSDVMRRYLSQRLGLNTFKTTTAELMVMLDQRSRKGRLSEEATGHVRAVFERADLAKFADQYPPEATSRHAIEEAHAALDATEQAMQRRVKRSPPDTVNGARLKARGPAKADSD